MASTHAGEGNTLSGHEQGSAVALLTRMVQFDSRTETPGETELAAWLVERMRDSGLEADLQEVTPGRYNAIGFWRGSGGGQSLLFNGHIDTNPATEGWTLDPWQGLVDQKFVYGLGVSNMKAGCASYLQAVTALMRRGIRLKGDVILTFVVGELQGGVGTLKFLEKGLRADWFVNCEPTDLSALTMHAGAFDYAIELTGSTRHSSKRDEAVDALAAACELVPDINKLAFHGAASEEHRSVNRAHVGVLHAALGRSLEEWRPPQVADFARILGTCRYSPSQSVEGVLDDLRGAIGELQQRYSTLQADLRQHGEGATRAHMLPFEVSRQSTIVQTVNGAFQQVRGEPQTTGAVAPYCFYGSDAAHLLHTGGMQGVVCGPGGRYNTMPDERVDINDYLDMVQVHMLTMQAICTVCT